MLQTLIRKMSRAIGRELRSQGSTNLTRQWCSQDALIGELEPKVCLNDGTSLVKTGAAGGLHCTAGC